MSCCYPQNLLTEEQPKAQHLCPQNPPTHTALQVKGNWQGPRAHGHGTCVHLHAPEDASGVSRSRKQLMALRSKATKMGAFTSAIS